MGGGTRDKNRSSYMKNHPEAELANYTEKEAPGRRVFISFHVDDEAQVELLRQQAKDDRFDIEFIDYSIKEPFDEKWKTQATERIRQSSIFICMIGPETHRREAVIWEINKAYELGKKVIGIRIYKNENHKVPQSLVDHNAKIIDWNLEDISREIEGE